MKKTLIILFLTIITISQLLSVNYYTIFGNDNYNTFGVYDYEITYDQIINGKLSNIYKKPMNGDEVIFMRYVAEEHLLYIVSYYTNSSKIHIDTYNTETNESKNYYFEEVLIVDRIFLIKEENSCLLISCSNMNDQTLFVKYDPNKNKIERMKDFDFSSANIILYGNKYIKSTQTDQISFINLKNDNYSFTLNDNSYDLNMPLPKNLSELDYRKDIIWFLNDQNLSLWMVNIDYSNTKVENNVVIMNKKNNSNKFIYYPLGFDIVKHLNGWLCSEKQDFFDYSESLGKAERDAIVSQFGEFKWSMFDYRSKSYFPGVLMLYHPDTERRITIETNQGDSEILLIQNDYVYYRVLDKIFKAKIKGNTLGTPVKIAQDPKIAEVHWLIVEGEEE